jgi:hypothetical protein
MKNAFIKTDTEDFISRINQLTPETKALWGKMNVGQMLAHCNVTYEFLYDNIHPRPNPFMKLILKLFVKKLVVGDKPYKPNNPTAPQFIITDEKEFEAEKERLINHIRKTQELGESHFDGKESHSFGVLNKTEWNNMFIKHLDHHFKQFGV